ncbi:hypothetical protein ACHAW6_008295 [Cyclotella cf. meneghiniana]
MVQDIKTAKIIWGPELGSLKGKTVRKKSPVVQVKITDIPLGIMEKNQDITLSIDVMKVNGIPFFNKISQHIKFGSACKLDDMKNVTILKHLKAIMFESTQEGIADLGAIVNIVSQDEHVPEIERYNRTIKENVRPEYSMLPFTHVPLVVIVELVYAQMF